MFDLHPYQPEDTLQGMLALLYELQQMLAEIAGLPAVSLQPAAGRTGELTALLVAAAYFRDSGQQRTKVLAPDSAHGTNPASAADGRLRVGHGQEHAQGFVDMDDLAAKLDDRTAVFMITNPNTLGMFDRHIRRHRRDGARGRRADLSRRCEHERDSGHQPGRAISART